MSQLPTPPATELPSSGTAEQRTSTLAILRSLNSPYRRVKQLRKLHNAAADLIEALDRELTQCDADWRRRGEIIREQREQLKGAQRSETQPTASYVDAHLDNVLRASGSALKNYTMEKTLGAMRSAMRNAINGGAQVSAPAGVQAATGVSDDAGSTGGRSSSASSAIEGPTQEQWKAWAEYACRRFKEATGQDLQAQAGS